jgi:transposase
MDSHTHSAQARLLEVVETGRRRRWTESEKLKIVLESFAAPRLVSSTARRHGISRSLLVLWRRTLAGADSADEPGFVPAIVGPEIAAPEGAPSAAPSAVAAPAPAIVVELACGARVTIGADATAAVIKAALQALR